jgi:peroxiredoxin Q/BCP
MAAKKKAKRVGSATTRPKATGASSKAAARGVAAATSKGAKPTAKSNGAKPPAKSSKSTKLPAKRAKRAPESVPKESPPRKRRPLPAQAATPDTISSVDVGAEAPSFDLADETGARVSSRELAGQSYVLYFYPKDDTPGCTTEACGFRDALPEFQKLGVRVIGVSPDSSASHERFRAKYGLTFSLLSDADKQLATAYAAWALKKNYGREYMGVVRSTFLIDSDGVIRNVWRGVKVNGHVEKVQSAAAALG